MIPCNLTRCTQNDKTAISPGIDQKNILFFFLHESSICSNASFKTTVSSLCWLATAPAYLWTTYPGKKTKPKTWGVFLSELTLALSPCQLPAFFSDWACLSFLKSTLVASPLWKLARRDLQVRTACSRTLFPVSDPLHCPSHMGHVYRKKGLPAYSQPSALSPCKMLWFWFFFPQETSPA